MVRKLFRFGAGASGMNRRLLAALFLVLAVRLIPWSSVFDDRSPWGVAFAGPDEWVHFLRARVFADTGRVPEFSHLFNAPQGLVLHWPLGYDTFLGIVTSIRRPANTGLRPDHGRASGRTRGLIMARTCDRSAAGPSPSGPFFRRGLRDVAGRDDHHAFEIAFFWLPASPQETPRLAGFALGIAFHITPIAIILAGTFLLTACALALDRCACSPCPRKRRAYRRHYGTSSILDAVLRCVLVS